MRLRNTGKYMIGLGFVAMLVACSPDNDPPAPSTVSANLGGTTAAKPKLDPSDDPVMKLQRLHAEAATGSPPAADSKGRRALASPSSPGAGSAGSASQTKGGDKHPIDVNRINQLRDLKVVPLKAAGNLIHAWVMNNESKRQEGMMFLTDSDVKENEGMIFVFPDLQSAQNGFWMHNCPLGLDIIWIDPQKRVINVSDGKPQTDDSVFAKRDFRWVLEMKHGWSARHGLKPGNAVSIPDLKAE